jgi:hypothetical protein
MAQQNKTTLQSNINTDLADNNTGAIGAGDVRNNMINLTDSLPFLSGSINGFSDINLFKENVFVGYNNIPSDAAEKLVTLSITQSSADTTAAVSIDGEFRLINEGGTITHLNYNNTSTNYIRGNQLYIDNATSGSCDVIITGSVTGSAFTGSFVGDGSGLTNLPSSNPFPYVGDAKITGSLTVSGSGDTNIFGNFTVYGNTPANESCITSYTSGRILTDWNNYTNPVLSINTSIDAGNITLTSNFTDFLTLRDNGTVKALSREDGMRFTRLAFETGTITNDSVVTIPKDVTGTVALELKGYTVASLPAGTVGDRAYVTDATSPTYLGTLTGGGTITCPVFYNGFAWVSA